MTTTREKVLTVLVGGFILLAGLGFLFYLFVYSPLAETAGMLKAAQNDLDDKKGKLKIEQNKNKTIVENSPRLAQWKALSLPELAKKDAKKVEAFNADLQVVYEKFLDTTFRKHGFSSTSFAVVPKELPKPLVAPEKGTGVAVARTGGPKVLPYTQLGYTVAAVGKHENMLKVLADFHKAPVLHEVKSMTLERVLQPKAGQSITDIRLIADIEVLQVQGAEVLGSKERPEVMVDPARLGALALLPSQYADHQSLLQNDMFLGKPPPPRKGPERIAEAPKPVEKAPDVKVDLTPTKPREEPRDVLGVIRLTLISYDDRWEAQYYNQASGKRERLTIGVLGRTLTFKDKHDNVLLKGEVLNISTTLGIYFKDESGKLYRWGSGESLYEAMQRPLEVVASGRKAIVVKGVQDVPGAAVMSQGDVLEPYAPRPAEAYGLGIGLGGLITPVAPKEAAIASRERPGRPTPGTPVTPTATEPTPPEPEPKEPVTPESNTRDGQ